MSEEKLSLPDRIGDWLLEVPAPFRIAGIGLFALGYLLAFISIGIGIIGFGLGLINPQSDGARMFSGAIVMLCPIGMIVFGLGGPVLFLASMLIGKAFVLIQTLLAKHR